jgi:uncharacterized phiE125 gp8 family phage protein
VGSSLVTAPTSEPVTVFELRGHLRIDDTESDSILGFTLRSARLFVENFLRRVLITQTWACTLSEWPLVRGAYCIDLPMQPVQSVTSITYLDGDGVTQTLATDQYALRNSGADNLARIEPAYGVTWPTVRAQSDAITVTYVAGYGASSAVPMDIKAAIMLQAELQYDRSPTMRETIEAARDSLLMPHRVVRL